MIIYLSGQMTGLTKEEYKAAFDKAKEQLEAEGHKVFNPADDDWVERLDISYQRAYQMKLTEEYDNILMADLQFLLGLKHMHHDNVAIYMLSNWEQSDGAKAEHYYAKAIKMNIIYQGEKV